MYSCTAVAMGRGGGGGARGRGDVYRMEAWVAAVGKQMSDFLEIIETATGILIS